MAKKQRIFAFVERTNAADRCTEIASTDLLYVACNLNTKYLVVNKTYKTVYSPSVIRVILHTNVHTHTHTGIYRDIKLIVEFIAILVVSL